MHVICLEKKWNLYLESFVGLKSKDIGICKKEKEKRGTNSHMPTKRHPPLFVCYTYTIALDGPFEEVSL